MNTANKKIEIINEAEESAYSEDGVDLTLIRWMLSLSPEDRLRLLQKNVQNIVRLRNGFTRK